MYFSCKANREDHSAPFKPFFVPLCLMLVLEKCHGFWEAAVLQIQNVPLKQWEQEVVCALHSRTPRAAQRAHKAWFILTKRAQSITYRYTECNKDPPCNMDTQSHSNTHQSISPALHLRTSVLLSDKIQVSFFLFHPHLTLSLLFPLLPWPWESEINPISNKWARHCCFK